MGNASAAQTHPSLRQQTALLRQLMFKIVSLPLPPFLRREDSFALQKQIKHLPIFNCYNSAFCLRKKCLSESGFLIFSAVA